MSEEEVKVKVTSDKPKDPKKVEAGKRLGALSKQLRERKMREKIKSEDNKMVFVLALLGVVVAVVGTIFTVKTYFLEASKTPEVQNPSPAPPTPAPTPTPKKLVRSPKLITLDD